MTNKVKHYESLPIFENPMCLIRTPQGGQFEVEKAPLEQIRQIESQLVIFAIAGLYRTGKSYLMNCLAGRTTGFPLGNTIESKTKGIWVWCKIHPVKQDTVMVMLDTEGLGDVKKGNTSHDNRIVTLAALLCNVLVYNMMGVIDQSFVEKLTFVTEMSNNICFKNKIENDSEDEQLDMILPTLVICLRDFMLELRKDDKELTPDEYLEDSLKLRFESDQNAQKYNRPRECIRKYFRKRKCFTFDRPGNKNVIKQLENVSADELNDTFLEDTKEFLNYAIKRGPKVLLSSKPVNGQIFASLVERYVNAIRDGSVPDVDDAVIFVSNEENERRANIAVDEFRNAMVQIKLPVLKKRCLDNLFHEIKQSSLATFRQEAMFNADKYEKRATKQIENLWEELKTENLKKVRIHCEESLNDMYNNFIGKHTKGNRYNTSGGYPLYRFDMDVLKKEYLVTMEGIDEYEVQTCLRHFLENKEECDYQVMKKDQELTAKENQKAIEQRTKEHMEKQSEQQNYFESKIEEDKQQTEEHNKQIERQKLDYMKQDYKKLQAIMNARAEERKTYEINLRMLKEQKEEQMREFLAEIRQIRDNHLDEIYRIRESQASQLEGQRAYYERRINSLIANLKK